MFTWRDRYEEGEHALVWTEIASLGPDLGADPERLGDAVAVCRITMRRARANVARLVDLLPALGWEFAREPFRPPPPDVAAELDALESEIGRLPLALRIWCEEVGTVDLTGSHPTWRFSYPDPLVVEAPADHIRSEHALWAEDRRTDRELGSVFEVELAPDYLHKAGVSGGAPYSMAVPEHAVDALLLWEPHQTTFVNYLRIAFASAGMPGWWQPPGMLPGWARPPAPPPPELVEIAGRLAPL